MGDVTDSALIWEDDAFMKRGLEVRGDEEVGGKA